MVKSKMLIGLGFVAILIAGFSASEYLARQTTDHVGFDIGAPFILSNQYGEQRDETIFSGQHTALFFGFTHCPDICPTTLLDITRLRDEVAQETSQSGSDLQIVFVTLDPARDTAPVLKEYLAYFADDIIGLTGDEGDVLKMASEWGIYRNQVALEDGSYTLDHTATIFLINQQGRLAGTISLEETDQIARTKLDNFLRK